MTRVDDNGAIHASDGKFAGHVKATSSAGFPAGRTGSGWGRFTPGEPITDVSQLAVGDLLTEHNEQFDADNLVRVIRVDTDRGIFYGRFVSPEDTAQPRLSDDREVAHWGEDLSGGGFHRAVPAVVDPEMPPCALCRKETPISQLSDIMLCGPCDGAPDDDLDEDEGFFHE